MPHVREEAGQVTQDVRTTVDASVHWIYNSLMAIRRRKTKALRKDEQLRLRLTAAEKAAWTKAAQLDGLDLSSWLRRLATHAAKSPHK